MTTGPTVRGEGSAGGGDDRAGGFGEEVVDAVLAHMNDDHAEDSLRIVRAHGYPAATSAEMTSLDAHGGTWHVVDAKGEASLRVAWPGGPVTERAQLRREVVALHEAARAALGG